MSYWRGGKRGTHYLSLLFKKCCICCLANHIRRSFCRWLYIINPKVNVSEKSRILRKFIKFRCTHFIRNRKGVGVSECAEDIIFLDFVFCWSISFDFDYPFYFFPSISDQFFNLNLLFCSVSGKRAEIAPTVFQLSPFYNFLFRV